MNKDDSIYYAESLPSLVKLMELLVPSEPLKPVVHNPEKGPTDEKMWEHKYV